MTRSPSPLAWRPDFPGAPREAHWPRRRTSWETAHWGRRSRTTPRLPHHREMRALWSPVLSTQKEKRVYRTQMNLNSVFMQLVAFLQSVISLPEWCAACEVRFAANLLDHLLFGWSSWGTFLKSKLSNWWAENRLTHRSRCSCCQDVHQIISTSEHVQ